MLSTLCISTLAIAAMSGPRDGPTPDRTPAEFRPSVHGFAFVNHFVGSVVDGLFGVKVTGGGESYGLCGGMCAAAADYFLLRADRPADSTPPKNGSTLYTYLARRQLDSLGEKAAMAGRFLNWMALGEIGPVGTMVLTVGGFDEAAGRIRAGKFAPIGLVYVDKASGRGPWSNHQVLGYAVAGQVPRWTVWIYDPNFPNSDDARVDVRLESVGMEFAPGPFPIPVMAKGVSSERVVSAPEADEKSRRAKHVRGFFAMPYEPTTPPAR